MENEGVATVPSAVKKKTKKGENWEFIEEVKDSGKNG